jgi:GTP pyrophosphokinase
MAKRNGEIVPLNYELQNGEVIEILTKPDSSPKLEWLSFVKTQTAKNKIKSYFRSFDKEDNFKQGRELINEKLKQLGKPLLDPKLSLLKNYDGKILSFKEREELVRLVGNGSLLPSLLMKKIFTSEELIGKAQKAKIPQVKFKIYKESDLGKYVIVGGEKGLPIRRAKCCNPSFGEQIVGYITRGKSITIHKSNCKILKNADKARYISASWDNILNKDEILRQVSLLIETLPNIYLMKEINKVIESVKASILQFFIQKKTAHSITWKILIEVYDFDQLEYILSSIENIEGVNYIQKIS